LIRIRSALLFVLQSIVVGLAVAFLVVLIRPDLLPGIGTGNGASSGYADAVATSAPAVANVYTKRLVEAPSYSDERTRFRVESSFGSAVVIDPEGYLVTNYHVVAQAAEIRVQLADGRVAIPDLVGVDAETDLALLKIDLGVVPAIRLGSSTQLRIGDVVLAIGNPYGFSKSVTQGIVSGTGRYVPGNLTTFQDYIQTDAAINSGNSGGALINTAGELVGINTAILAQDANTEGISFAIPVDLMRGVTDEIKQHGRVIRGWMGLEPDDLTPAERDAFGLENNVGILLSDVYAGGPADAAGLRAGDVIIEIAGQRIYSQRQALLLVTAAKPGDELELTGIRDGVEFRATIIAAERPGAPD
jgi:serine peptidase DegS